MFNYYWGSSATPYWYHNFKDPSGSTSGQAFLISGTYYPPRSRKIVSLIQRIKQNKFAKSTLGGCIIELKDNFVLISKELKIKKMLYQPRK